MISIVGTFTFKSVDINTEIFTIEPQEKYQKNKIRC